MEVDAISRQARAAVDHLTEQLRSLELVSYPPPPFLPPGCCCCSTPLTPPRHEQTALLTSLHLTSSTLSTLPSYTAIAPTLSQIPHYESKLARLKAAMAQQQRDVAELKRRALEAGMKRRQNLGRIEERRRGERERDRTVLRAKHAEEGGGEGEEVKEEEVEEGVSELEVSQVLPTVGVVKTVKRKKKARQADIQ